MSRQLVGLHDSQSALMGLNAVCLSRVAEMTWGLLVGLSVAAGSCAARQLMGHSARLSAAVHACICMHLHLHAYICICMHAYASACMYLHLLLFPADAVGLGCRVAALPLS